MAGVVAIDPSEFRHALGHFLTGVTIVTTTGADGEPVGMTANAFTSVSLDPPLALVCIARSAASFAAMEQSERYAVHILHRGQHELSGLFARSVADGAEKFGKRPLGNADGPRPQALVNYIASLERTRTHELSVVLPGHGDPVDDHRRLIDERLAMHNKRRQRLMGLIAERARTAYELAGELWGNVAVTQAFLTISEVVGHVDLLLNDGLVREAHGPSGVIVFEQA